MKSSIRAAWALACLSALAGGVSGCAHHSRAETVAEPPMKSWREVATDADRDRISKWRDGWTDALAKARASGNGPRIAAEGALLTPDAALANPAPPPGDYDCRVIKLGAQGSGGLDYVTYPAFTCRIEREKDMLSFTKVDGSQRPVGLLFANDDVRMIFLGTMMLGDETRALDYGRDPDRDMAGAFERVGPRRWRLVLPWPKWESMLDVIELVPKA